MTEIEKYAVGLVEAGAAFFAQDDMDESGEFTNEEEWREACALGARMALAVKNNPESFLGWYLSTVGEEVEI
jgi:hypothetical protein